MKSPPMSLETFLKLLATQKPAATILRSPAQDAVSAIVQLQADIGQTSNTIAAANFGPFPLGGSCDYDCFIGICLYTYNWTWNLDFSNVREPMQGAVAQVGSAAAQYTDAFQPAHDWLKNTLPQFSADFSNQANLILSTNAAIMQAGGVATAAQIAAVQNAFAAITSGLSNGQSQMGAATSAVAQFVDTLVAIEGGLSATLASLQSDIDTWVANTQNNFVNGMECGQGDADNQINGAVATFNASVATIQTSVSQLTSDTNTVAAATGQFVATLATIGDQYQNVSNQVATAQQYPASVIQDLHLDIASNEWAQLAEYAAANIQ